jgi:hypothetical protein
MDGPLIMYLMEFNTAIWNQIIECDLTVDEKVIHIEKKKNRDIKRKYKYYNQIGNAIIN